MTTDMEQENTDWCAKEEATTAWNGETCASCGRQWGAEY